MIKLLTLGWLLLLSPPLSAKSFKDSCMGAFRDFAFRDARFYTDFATTPAQREHFNAIVETAATPAEAFEKVLDQYIQYRTAILPEEAREVMAAEMRKFIANVKFNSEGRFFANGRRVIVPEDFRNTVMLLSILAHEMEHAIQINRINNARVLKGSFVNSLKTVLNVIFSPAQIWRMEFGAMRAEWEMLHALPESAKEEARKAILQVANPKYREHLLRSLRDSHLDFEQYMAGQYEGGRYSPGSNLMISAQRIAVVAFGAQILFMGTRQIGKVAGAEVCESLSPDNPIRFGFCGSLNGAN